MEKDDAYVLLDFGNIAIQNMNSLQMDLESNVFKLDNKVFKASIQAPMGSIFAIDGNNQQVCHVDRVLKMQAAQISKHID